MMQFDPDKGQFLARAKNSGEIGQVMRCFHSVCWFVESVPFPMIDC